MSGLIIVIQARMKSTRLPDKIMFPLCGQPLLVRLVERVSKATYATRVVVATTTQEEDKPIAELCKQHELDCFRGHPLDLLDRHYAAAIHYQADTVVKIPSDCPLIDPHVIDRVIGQYYKHLGEFDYVSNLHPATYPDGNDVEVMSIDALEYAWKHASRPLEREHTTPYLWENPSLFKIGNVVMENGADYSMTHRWTIDYHEDYEFIRQVYEALYPVNPDFTLNDILHLLERERPGLKFINEKFAGVNWYRHHLDDLRTISKDQTRLYEAIK